MAASQLKEQEQYQFWMLPSCVHTIKKNNKCHIPGTVLGAENTTVNKVGRVSALKLLDNEEIAKNSGRGDREKKEEQK